VVSLECIPCEVVKLQECHSMHLYFCGVYDMQNFVIDNLLSPVYLSQCCM